MPGINTLQAPPGYQPIYFYSSLLLPVYTSCCILGSVPFLAITMPLGLSVADDAVFGAIVIFGGPLGDIVFRKVYRRVMFLIGSIQAFWAWPFIGSLVMFFHPLE